MKQQSHISLSNHLLIHRIINSLYLYLSIQMPIERVYSQYKDVYYNKNLHKHTYRHGVLKERHWLNVYFPFSEITFNFIVCKLCCQTAFMTRC